MLKFEFSVEEINVVLSALAKLPYEVSAQLIGKIQEAGQKQLPQSQQEPKEEE